VCTARPGLARVPEELAVESGQQLYDRGYFVKVLMGVVGLDAHDAAPASVGHWVDMVAVVAA
jgi:hypothetical protein